MMNIDDSSINEELLLRSLVEGTASETGTRFFRALTKNISHALGAQGAWVAEYLPEVQRLRALAFWLGNDYVDHYEYDIVGTPCEAAIRNKTRLHVPENVVELFPGDPDLPKMGAVSYVGYPLLSPEKSVLGNLAVMDTRPVNDHLNRATHDRRNGASGKRRKSGFRIHSQLSFFTPFRS